MTTITWINICFSIQCCVGKYIYPAYTYIFSNIFQIAAIRKTSKFEDEIKEEQENRKREEEDRKRRQQSFKDRAALFGGQGV